MESTRITTAPQGSQPAQAARGKPAGQGGTAEAGAASPGDFLALLSSLGGEPTEAALPGSAPAFAALDDGPQPDSASDASGTDAAAVAAWQGLLLSGNGAPQMPNATPPQGAGTATQPAEISSKGGALEVGFGQGQAATDNAGTLGLPGSDGAAAGLVAETLKLDTGTSGTGTLLAAGAATAAARMAGKAQGVPGLRSDALLGTRGASVPGEGLQPAHSVTATLGSPALATALGGAGSAVAGPVERSLSVAGGSGMAETTTLAPMGTAGAAEPMLRGDASAGSGRPDQGPAGDAGPWWGGGAAEPQVESAADLAGLFADPTQAGAEEQLADRVAYWINQKTQNAELTLDRDGQPVEVSVSLSGNEAHVAFRSDQAQTRELLDQSMAQLRDLLRSEGLVLSGMSVGTSSGNGSGGGAADPQRDRQGARHVQVATSVPANAAGALRGGITSDRAVDVFV